MNLKRNDALVRLSHWRRGIDRLPRTSRARRERDRWSAAFGRDAAMRMAPGNERIAVVRAGRFLPHAPRGRVFDEPGRL